MDLPPLPADRQHALDLQLEQLLKDHFGPRPRQFGKPLSLYVDTGFREDPNRLGIDETVSFAHDWFARLALEYLLYWFKTGNSNQLPADWLPAVKAEAIDTTRTVVWRDRRDWFDKVCLREVAAELERCGAWFLTHMHHLATGRRQRLAEQPTAGHIPVEIQAMAALARVSVESLRIAPPGKINPRTGRRIWRPEIQQFKKDQKIKTNEALAEKLNVGFDILKSIAAVIDTVTARKKQS
jgi:hypothetical protein